MKRFVLAAVLAAALPAVAAYAIPSDYGTVIIDNYSQNAGLAPVVFEHWLHRSMFTCRLCHVDIGFAMEADGTNITSESNRKGFYCGTCHDGRKTFGDKTTFAACTDHFTIEESRRCDRCHSKGLNVKMEYAFDAFAARLPRKGIGNGIDWEEAEAKGLIRLTDYIEGVSMKRPPLKKQDDFSIKSKGTWMPDIVFSHKKHTVWNGCEVCHPDIFPNVKKGDTQFSMLEIYEGEYCGVCHNKVAFPLRECQRCHINPVE